MSSRIVATCPTCNAKLAVASENAGKRLRCPKCQTTVQVPEAIAEVVSLPDETQRWKVVAGTKKGGPFSKAKLRQLVDDRKLPSEAFIQDDAEIIDWSEVQTIEWLFDAPTVGVTKYCPECDCRVLVEDVPARQLRACPNCTVPVAFVDYLNLNANPQYAQISPEPWGKFDVLVIVGAVAALAAGFFGALALLWNPPFAVLIGFIFLVAGSGLFSVTFHHRSQTSKYRAHLPKIEKELTERSHQLSNALYELQGLKRSLQTVQADLERTSEEQLRKQQVFVAEELEAAKEELRQQQVLMAEDLKEEKKELHRDRKEVAVELATAKNFSNAVHRMAERFLDETRKWWSSKLTGDNFQSTKDRITKAITFCRKQGYTVSTTQERELMAQLKADYEIVLRRENEKGEQKRIREQMREEQRVERELKREMERIDTEKRVIEKALAEALQKVGADHSAEVEALREKLREAEERGQRTQAQAELTKVGYVYVISNIGSFGEDVFKVGLTRRLEPLDRVKELGDASVPFTFDVHMMIFSEDSPKLERTLHLALHRYRVNRINFRKEFFRVDLETIRAVVEEHHGVVEYVADAEALQYRESLRISPDDAEYQAKVEEAINVEDENEDDDLEGRDEVLPLDVE